MQGLISLQALGQQEVETGGRRRSGRRADQSPHGTGVLLQEIALNHFERILARWL
jgi:hypothetical protein